MADSTETLHPAVDAASVAGIDPAPGLRKAIRDAIAGSHTSYDYTAGSIGRAILLLSVPMVLEMVMESVFAVVDVFFVAKLGAGKPERGERAVWLAGFYNMCFLGVVGLVFVVFAGTIVGVFTNDPAVAPYGVDCLRIVACGFLFYAYGMVLTQSFNGAGDTLTPTIINLFVFWLWEIPLAYVLAFVFKLGPRGVFMAMTISFSTLAIVSAVIFRRGHWKTRTV